MVAVPLRVQGSSLAGGQYSLHTTSRECRAHLRTQIVCSSSQLPNGLRIKHVSKPDVPFLYREVFEEQSYIQHGISLGKGDTVLDIGANIGLFALWASERVGAPGRVVAIEPLPPCYEALQHNITSHEEWCRLTGAHPATARLSWPATRVLP